MKFILETYYCACVRKRKQALVWSTGSHACVHVCSAIFDTIEYSFTDKQLHDGLDDGAFEVSIFGRSICNTQPSISSTARALASVYMSALRMLYSAPSTSATSLASSVGNRCRNDSRPAGNGACAPTQPQQSPQENPARHNHESATGSRFKHWPVQTDALCESPTFSMSRGARVHLCNRWAARHGP